MASFLLSHLDHVLEVFYTLLQDLRYVGVLLVLSCTSCSRALLILLSLRKAGIGHEALVIVLHVDSLGLGEINILRLVTTTLWSG